MTLKSKRFPLITAFCLFFFSACASVQVQVPQKSSDSDTLVAFPLLVIPADQAAYNLTPSYRLWLENIDTGKQHSILIKAYDPDYILTEKLPAGTYSFLKYEIASGLNGTQDYNLNCTKYLTVAPGKLTICPYKFSIVIYKVNNSDNYCYYRSFFNEIKEEEMTLTVDKIKSYENTSSWPLNLQ